MVFFSDALLRLFDSLHQQGLLVSHFSRKLEFVSKT